MLHSFAFLVSVLTFQKLFVWAEATLSVTQLSEDFSILTKSKDELDYATAFVLVNKSANPPLPWMGCFIDNMKLTPVYRPDPGLVLQIKNQLTEQNIHQNTEYFYHVYRMPFLREAKAYTLRIGASASKAKKENAVIFSIPLHVENVQVSSLFRVEYPRTHIMKDEMIQLQGDDLQWDDKI